MRKKEIIDEIKIFRKDLRRFAISNKHKSEELRERGNIEDSIFYYGYASGESSAAADLGELIRHLEKTLYI